MSKETPSIADYATASICKNVDDNCLPLEAYVLIEQEA
jgi:hypothetical protein